MTLYQVWSQLEVFYQNWFLIEESRRQHTRRNCNFLFFNHNTNAPKILLFHLNYIRKKYGRLEHRDQFKSMTPFIIFFCKMTFYQTFRNPDYIKEIFHYRLGEFPFKTGFLKHLMSNLQLGLKNSSHPIN